MLFSVRASSMTFTLCLVIAVAGLCAHPVAAERIDLKGTHELVIREGVIQGDEFVDYVVSTEPSQTLSVDIKTSNPSAYFNILPSWSEQAIFIGSSKGTVADVVVRTGGDHILRVYLMRAAARRGETAEYSIGVSLGGPDYADGLAGGPDYWKVTGVDGTLNVRSGPSTRYAAVGVLNNGRTVQNRSCRMTGSERWCQIRVTGSGVQGWVAGRFLVEGAAPRAPEVPEGGPVGNGMTFDATGYVPCSSGNDQPRPCPFGVIREGPGNAGVWISSGDGSERQILFEGGVPVTTGPAGTMNFKKSGSVFEVHVDSEFYEIPEAVVFGG